MSERFFEFQKAIRAHRADELYGSGDEGLFALTHSQTDYDVSARSPVFESRLTTPVPWRQAHPHTVVRRLDPSAEHSWGSAPMKEVDPRDLHATQRALTTGGLQHYYESSSRDFSDLFDKNRGQSNLHPIVYRSIDPSYPHDILLSGHHRAAVSLLKGRPLRALVVTGALMPR